ncbi:sialin-like [Planococcus citri]|uniref:sialin-like n=1 Tax=Planococcus citri TaxID=170843 RepID=UPI0031F92AB4
MMKKRVILWWMLFIGIVVHMFQKTNVNIAIISMVKFETTENELHNTDEGICTRSSNIDVIFFKGLDDSNNQNTHYQVEANHTQHNKHQNKGLPWTEHQQNLILGGFFWFAWSAQFFGGILAHKFGSKLTFGLSTFIACAMSSLIPRLAYLDATVVLVVRVLQGFIASLGIPAGLVGIVGQWSPPDERGKFMSVFLGVAFGVAVGYPIFGTIGEYFSWESIFYASTLMGAIWYGVWLLVVFDSPETHPTITTEEKKYIQERIGNNISKDKLPIPWKSILTSVPFWANVFCQFGIQWCIHTLNIYLPSYLRYVHGLDMKKGGYIAGAVFFVKSIVSVFAASITDFIIRKKYMSTQYVRKLSVFVSCVMGGAFLLAVPYAECNVKLAVVFLFVAITLHGFFIAGATVAILDMSPNFSSVLQGIAGTLAVSSGFLSPFLTDQLPFFNNDMEKWQYIFYITAGFSIGGGIIFIFFSDSTLQHWNSPKEVPEISKNSVEMSNDTCKQTP